MIFRQVVVLGLAACFLGGAPALLGQLTGLPAAEVVSRLTSDRSDSTAGNAVDTGTGGFSLQATAIEVQGLRTLDFTLFQDSISTPAAIVGPPLLVGPGWTHSYASRVEGVAGGPVTVHWDDHRRNRFDFSGGNYTPVEESARYERLRRIDNAAGCSNCRWEAIREDGSILLFDNSGVLQRTGNKIRQFLIVEKTLGRVTRVTEPASQRRLDFFYNQRGRIAYVGDGADRRAYFEYTAAGLLAAIHHPAKLSPAPVVPAVSIPIPDAPGGPLERILSVAGRTDPVGVVVLDGTSIGHSRPSDLLIALRSPSGREVDITGLAELTTNTSLSFRNVPISGFHGEPANGNWTLRIRDTVAGQTGSLDVFSLQVTGPTYPTVFRYHDVGLISEAVDSLGARIFANQFDGLGRVVAQDDGRPDTPLAQFAYQQSASGVVTVFTDRLGGQFRYEHDARHRLMRYADPLGGETRYEYAANGDRTAIVDALGRRTQFQHDAEGNVTRMTDAAGHVTQFEYTFGRNLSAVVDAEGNRTTFTVNDGNITQVRDAEGHEDRHSYGGNGQRTSVMLADGAGMTLDYRRGQVVSGQMMRGPSVGGADYTEIGLPSELDDGGGRKIRLHYDDRGNVVRRIDPLGGEETFEYDERGRLVRQTSKTGAVSRIEYDGNGNAVRRIDPLGQSIRMFYDADDRLARIVDARGGATEREYDAVGRMVAQTNPLGETVRHVYDAVGNRTSTAGPDGETVGTIRYDELDLAIATSDALGLETRTRYDRLQRPIEVVDAAGRSTKLFYDRIGRLVRVEDPLGRTTRQAFHPDDVVRSFTDGTGAESSYSYDQQNRITAFEPSTGSVAQIRWDYDARGLPTRERLPGGGEKNYQYDDAGRLTQIAQSGDGARPTRRYEYDAAGNLTTVRSGGQVQLRRTFDAADRVTAFTDAHGDTLRYAYDANGNLTRLTHPDGKRVDYIHDAANRLAEVVDWAGRRTTFGYDENSRLNRIELPNGTRREMSYDAAGRLVRRRDLTAAGSPIVDYAYRYDATHFVAEERGGAMGAAPPYRPAAANFSYRNDGRLLSIGAAQANYDARGNLLTLPAAGGGFSTLGYDADANLVRGPGTTYEYDAEDRLIAWTTGGGRTRLTVDPHAPLAQVVVQRAPNGSATRFVYGGGLLYEETPSGGVRVFHYDQRGSTVAFSDASGAVSGRVFYGPYGEIFARDGQSESIFLFCGLWGVVTDPAGLNYMRFRWYAPQVKRFLTPDSHYGGIVEPASLNRYLYAASNPVNFIDPHGEFIGALVGAVVGAVVNVAVAAVTAAVTGQPLTPGDLIGAAVGGAITGGLIGACGPACGALGATIAAGIGASAIGAAAGNALGQGIDIALGHQDRFDAGAFGQDVAISAAFGALPFGRGGKGAATAARKAVSGGGKAAARGSRASVSKLARPPRPSLVRQNAQTNLLRPKRPRPLVRQNAQAHLLPEPNPWRDAIRQAPFDFSLGLIQNGVGLGIGAIASATAPGTEAALPDALTVRTNGLRDVNAGGRGVHGEYTAWSLYQAVHSLAGRALPNNPNPALPQF